MPSSQPDFIVENHGSIILLCPITHLAREWAEEYIGEDNGFQALWPTVTLEGAADRLCSCERAGRYVGQERSAGPKDDGLVVTRG